ncbi:hypothetical protein MHYP_G00238350 [Metynnis hypsauchen]
MSCLWSWCSQIHEDPDTDSERKEEKQNKKRKKGKKKKSWKIQWKKDRKNKKKEGQEGDEEKRQPNQQPGKVEVEAGTLNLPVGLESNRHNNVSAEALNNTAPPLTEEADETIKSLTTTLLVEAQMKQLLENEAVKMEAAEATNKMKSICLEGSEEKPLQKHLDNLVSITGDKTEVISELLDIQLENPASVQPLENEAVMMTEVLAAQAEAKDDLTFLATEAPRDLLVIPLEDIEEETEEKPEKKPLAVMDEEKKDLPEKEVGKGKKKKRRGSRDTEKTINYTADRDQTKDKPDEGSTPLGE